ncbi:hypothetical protein BOW53_13775 [Solemya pervernicosa gill symbiont]|uniref:Uncharacterized protein n=1 Tax=Solemya pervernicosa gill symbiont TaxID=642797 RepID=A0A1T2L1J2_9GAMM|nr:tetratricopeptide repeat protein [Solemya pervernicosa gill symbiont]OOZ38890.1 hypothetical protein BOW53_13775 [Solemya pervernicosa gill symbiont]
MSNDTPEFWTSRGFLDQIRDIDQRMEDRAFAFILGAGASVPSGIDSGSVLVERWLTELKQRLSHNIEQPLNEWATADSTGIEGFDYTKAASFYPMVFERRFRGDYDEGHAYLEECMEGREPSLGYSVLSKILADTRHKVVITTNFDNLVADALATYTQKHPLVAGHESLTSFVRTRLRRPIVAKIHRDLFLGPINGSDVDELKEGWEQALKKLFEHYTPIVIGYGGNDGSLMDMLDKMDEGSIPGGIYWCFRKDSPPTDERILRVINKQQGKLVPILGFDELMMELGNRFYYKRLDSDLEKQYEERVKRYRDQFEAIQKRINEDNQNTDEDVADLKEAINSAIGEETDWWGWQLKINEANDLETKEHLYRQALAKLPNSDELACNFAQLLIETYNNYEEAEQLFRRATELAPNDATHAGNIALFMKRIRGDSDEAERLIRLALEPDPKHANNTAILAALMHDARKDYNESERLYQRALKLDPTGVKNIGNFALFMETIRSNFDEAEHLYRRAISIDPSHTNNTINFASFLHRVRKNYHEAERLYRRSLELDPNHINGNVNFSEFLIERGRLSEADKYAKNICKKEQHPSQGLAEGLLYLALLSLIDHGDATPFLKRLKGVLASNYQRGSWDFEPVFNAISDRIDEETLNFYRQLGTAILDDSTLPDLENNELWHALESVSPDTPWDS